MNVKQITIVHKMQPVETILDLTIAHVMIIMKGMDLTVQVRKCALNLTFLYLDIIYTLKYAYTNKIILYNIWIYLNTHLQINIHTSANIIFDICIIHHTSK